MTYYRLYRESDKQQVVELCNKYNLDMPQSGVIFVSEESGSITGICGVRMVAFLDPLISDSSALTAHSLYQMALGSLLTSGCKEIFCITKDESKLNLYNKCGFRDLDSHILKKDY